MAHPPYVRLRGSARTDKGIQRSNNEDSVHFELHAEQLFAMVADGMGGAAAGEEASRIAVETVNHHFVDYILPMPSLSEDELLERLLSAVQQANQNIIERAKQMPEYKGMGTTLTMALARDGMFLFAHVGDSRAYFIDGYNGSIIQLTADHSFVQALVDAGHIRPDEADHHPMRNVLYRALGQAPDLDVDLISGVSLQSGDRIVLCSDGLTLHVKGHEIAEIALSDDDPDRIAAALIELANQRGGKDNISVVVIVASLDTTTLETEEAELELLDHEDDDPTTPLHSPNGHA